jgi:hypothetical protein
MSCDGGHLGFPNGIKNSNLVKDIPMIIPLQFGFSQFISFREEDLWTLFFIYFILKGPGELLPSLGVRRLSSVVCKLFTFQASSPKPLGRLELKDIPMIIPLQFGFSQFISFREEDLWNFSQSEHIIGPGSHVEYPTGSNKAFLLILNGLML